jgi:hypothetical protein
MNKFATVMRIGLSQDRPGLSVAARARLDKLAGRRLTLDKAVLLGLPSHAERSSGTGRDYGGAGRACAASDRGPDSAGGDETEPRVKAAAAGWEADRGTISC